MVADGLVKLECRAEVLAAVASKLERFGPVGAAEWLVSLVWLCVAGYDLIASSSTVVLPDGYVARPLAIHRIDDFAERLESKLSDISTRLVGRRGDLDLPQPGRPDPPTDLQSIPPGPYSLTILVRAAAHRDIVHRVACGLLFDFSAGGMLLIATDIATLAMTVSEEEGLIGRYTADCERVSADEYFKLGDG